MAGENAEIVRRVYEAYNRGNWDTLFSNTHPEFEMTTQRMLGPGTLRSREAVQGFFEDYDAQFDAVGLDVDELVEKDEIVVALVTRRARPRGGSVDVVVRNGHLWTIRDGRILSMTTFPDPADALEAAGLPR